MNLDKYEAAGGETLEASRLPTSAPARRMREWTGRAGRPWISRVLSRATAQVNGRIEHFRFSRSGARRVPLLLG